MRSARDKSPLSLSLSYRGGGGGPRGSSVREGPFAAEGEEGGMERAAAARFTRKQKR